MSRTKWNGTFAFKVFALIAIIAPALAQSYNPPAPVASAIHPRHEKALGDIYQELIEINNTNAVGDCTGASRAMAARLMTGGYADDEMQSVVSVERPKIKRERLAVSNKCEPGPFDYRQVCRRWSSLKCRRQVPVILERAKAKRAGG